MIKHLQKSGSATKADFIYLLKSELPAELDEKQKDTKVRSLIRFLKKSNQISRTSENKRTSAWQLEQNNNN